MLSIIRVEKINLLSNLAEIDLMAFTNSINATKAINPRTANRALRAILQPTLCF